MNIIAISDTHGLHDQLTISPTDILLHTGDITQYGTKEEVEDFLNWFSKQSATYKIFIGGNHDLYLEQEKSEFKKMLKKYKHKNVVYLENNSILIEGISIWGSPVCPPFLGMAFNRKDNEREKIWRKIPDTTDIILTHTPPYSILDKGFGCSSLYSAVMKIKPHLHIFGHIHSEYGEVKQEGIHFINASVAGEIDYVEMGECRMVNGVVQIVYLDC